MTYASSIREWRGAEGRFTAEIAMTSAARRRPVRLEVRPLAPFAGNRTPNAVRFIAAPTPAARGLSHTGQLAALVRPDSMRQIRDLPRDQRARAAQIIFQKYFRHRLVSLARGLAAFASCACR